MSYSFVPPKKKPILSLFSKVCLCFILITILGLFGTNIFIKFRAISLKENGEKMQGKYDSILLQIADINTKTKNLIQRRDAALDIHSSNNILKKSLHNIFDLVPDVITLKEINIDKNSLTIKGVTPTKDVYRLLLEAPLKSIFNTSDTTFYQLPNGWFSFVGINKMDNSNKSIEDGKDNEKR